ncbi:MAG: phage major capsid protein [Gammaproteobacteria bacterium]
MPSLTELRAAARTAAETMRAINDRAKNANRNITAAEERDWDTARAEFERLETEIARTDKIQRGTAELDEIQHRYIVDAHGNRVPLGLPGQGNTTEQLESEWTDGKGNAVRTLRSNESFREVLAGTYDPAEWRGLTLGGFCRALIAGPQTDVERRALAEGTLSAGGYSVPTPLAAAIIDRLRAKTAVFRAGATTVPMTSATLSLARLDTDPVASWHSENGNISDSDPTFSEVKLTARTLTSLVKSSKELIEDSLNLGDALTNAFARSLAIKVDQAALVGSGTPPEPKGLMTATGVNEVAMGTGNGASIADFSKLVALRLAMDNANAELPTGWIMAPRTLAALAGMQATDGHWLAPPDYLRSNAWQGGSILEPGTNANMPPWLTTTSVPVNQTLGTSSDCSVAFTGYFPDMLVGLRTGLQIQVLTEVFAGNYQTGFLASLRTDVQLAHGASFGRLIGIRP